MSARWARCSAVSAVAQSSWTMPRMPFMGVRISWLMLARKADFAWLAVSAASLAAAMAASVSRRSATSRMSSSFMRLSVLVRARTMSSSRSVIRSMSWRASTRSVTSSMMPAMREVTPVSPVTGKKRAWTQRMEPSGRRMRNSGRLIGPVDSEVWRCMWAMTSLLSSTCTASSQARGDA